MLKCFASVEASIAGWDEENPPIQNYRKRFIALEEETVADGLLINETVVKTPSGPAIRNHFETVPSRLPVRYTLTQLLRTRLISGILLIVIMNSTNLFRYDRNYLS